MKLSKKADYIITLIGKNPLPSYYSILNYADKETKIIGVCTEENSDTDSSLMIFENVINCINDKFGDVMNISFPCHKSEGKKIKKKIQEVFDYIIKNCDYENLGDRRVDVVLDYTGGTKAMSAYAYNYLYDIANNVNYNKVVLSSSYLSSEKEKIYQCSFKPIEMLSGYDITNLISSFEITKENVIRVHGYGIKNKDSLRIDILKSPESTNVLYSFDDIFLEKGKLNFVKSIEKDKLKGIVDSYFILSDIVEKVGGSEAKIELVVNGYDLNKCDDNKYHDYDTVRDKIYNSLFNVYGENLQNKVKIKFENEVTVI